MNSSTDKVTSTALASPIRAFHKAIAVPAILAVVGASFFLIWQTVIAVPALDFGSPGQVYLAEKAGAGPASIASPSEALMCFDRIIWERLCPGTTFAELTPVNVSDRNARLINLESHTISLSTAVKLGPLAPKCRGEKIPGGLAPGVWRLTGRADNACPMWLPLVGSFNVTVTSDLPSTLVSIKVP